jgi:hypothetical protein
LALFLGLDPEERLRRPDLVRRDRRSQRPVRGFVGDQAAGFHQGGQDGLVGGGLGALRDRAHRLTGLQAGIPQQREESRQRVALRVLGGFVRQHQQVDVGLRKQLAAAVAADREQRQPGLGRQAARPGRAQLRIDRRGARRDQRIDVVAAIEPRRQLGVSARQRSARRGRPGRIAVGRRRNRTAGLGGGGGMHAVRARCRRRAGG